MELIGWLISGLYVCIYVCECVCVFSSFWWSKRAALVFGKYDVHERKGTNITFCIVDINTAAGYMPLLRFI